MEDSDFLLTIAEIGVALAGFSALVSIVSQKAGIGDLRARVDRHFLLSLVCAGLLAVGFAVFPYVPLRFGMPPDAAWRLSSVGLFVAWSTYLWFSMRRISTFGVSAPALAKLFPTRFALFNFTLQGATLVGLAAGTLGMIGELITPIYLTGLCVLLYVSGVLFLALLVSLLDRGTAV